LVPAAQPQPRALRPAQQRPAQSPASAAPGRPSAARPGRPRRPAAALRRGAGGAGRGDDAPGAWRPRPHPAAVLHSRTARRLPPCGADGRHEHPGGGPARALAAARPGPDRPAGLRHLPQLAAAALPGPHPAQPGAGPGAGGGAGCADFRSPARGGGHPPAPRFGRPIAPTSRVVPMMRVDPEQAGPSVPEQQRLREQALLTEIDLLRRTLVRCSLAIRDPAPSIELCLRDLRQALRGQEAVTSLRALLPRLENVLAESEFMRASRVNKELAALSAQVARLEGRMLPEGLREALAEFARDLSRAPSRQGELLALYKAFGDLQWQLLEPLLTQRDSAAVGLFKRLLGSQAGAALPPQGHDPVAEGIAQVLRALLSESALPLKYQIELRRLLACLHGQVDAESLVRLVDGLGELVLESGEDQREMLDFLTTLNERLVEVQASLETLGLERAEGSALAEALDQSLLSRVGDMRTAVNDATDLVTLRQSISCRLEELLDGLAEQRAQREAREQALTDSLRQLSARVMELEREAEICRGQLNEQRREALRDPLTGLANRTAGSAELRQALERRRARPGRTDEH